MWRWIGPDGWMVQGVKYNKGDVIAADVTQAKISSFVARGYVEKVQAQFVEERKFAGPEICEIYSVPVEDANLLYESAKQEPEKK